MYPIWPGNTSGSSKKGQKVLLGRGPGAGECVKCSAYPADEEDDGWMGGCKKYK